MTIGGLSHTGKLEIEWVAGTWTDVTADVVWSRSVHIKVGRSSEFDDFQPGELAVSLYNESLTNTTGNYTPDNPLGANWPNVVKGKRIRWTITRSAVSYVRFLGRLKTIEADALDNGKATVTITAVDSLGAMAARTLSADWVEQWAARAASQTADTWPLDEDISATSFRNIGSGTGTLTLVPAASGAGSYQRGSVDQGVMLPGQVTLSPASGTFVGPVLAVDLRRTLGTNAVLAFSVKTSQTVTSGDLVLATAFDSSGALLWSLRLHPNGSDTALVLLDEVSPTYWFINGALDGSDKWLGISVYDNGSSTQLFVNNGADGNSASTNRSNTIRYLMIGGRVTSWSLIGKQTLCTPMSIAGIGAASAEVHDLIDHTRPLVVTAASTRASEIVGYCGLTRSPLGTLVPNVTRTDTSGRKALDAFVELMGTAGASTWHEYGTDVITTAWPDVNKPRTSTATITVEQDDDAGTPFTWKGAGDSRPTRVTVSSAFGSKTAIDAVTEAAGYQQPETWSSCAASATAAGALAGARLNRSVGARIPQLSVDLVTAANGAALFSQIMAVRPGYRLTVAGLPSAKLGVTQVDVYAMGWVEQWTQTQASFVFDVQPADRPAELVLDDATYGRLSAGTDASGNPLMTVTSGTAVGSTGNGTLVVTTASGPLLTTDAAAYPMDLNWNGERVTVTGPPTGSTTPATWRTAGAHYDSAGTAIAATPSQTVPAGVVASDVGIIVVAWVDGSGGAAPTLTASSPSGGTWTTLQAPYIGLQNMGWAVFGVTGLVAGNTFTISGWSPSRFVTLIQGWYSNCAGFGTPGALAQRDGVSSANSTAPSCTTTQATQTVVVIGAERTTATGTVVSSTSPTVTQRDFYEGTSSSTCSDYLGDFAGPASPGATSAVTLTYNSASGNGSGIQIPLLGAATGGGQQVTTTARGVAPTVARVHSANEGIDVWLTPTIAGV